MRIGSLFSGAGGLDMAVEAVFGGTVVWHSEIDKAASKVLAHRYPDVPNLGDITEINWDNWKPMLEVDILCGGFPCQDVSAAGKQAGIKDGTRSGLWSVFAEAIDILRPPIVIIENVRGLLSAQAHRNVESEDPVVGDGERRPVLRAAGAVLGDLSDIGYDAAWTTLAAGDIGAPHRRERVFIVAWREGSSTYEASQNSAALPVDLTGPLRAQGKADDTGKPPSPGPVSFLPTPRGSDGERGPSSEVGGYRPSGAERSIDLNTVAVTLVVKATKGGLLLPPTPLIATPTAEPGGSRSGSRIGEPPLRQQAVEMSTAWGKYEPAIRRWEQLTRPAPPPTEPNKNGNPRLSAAFSEWLMGWPAGWVTDPAIGISRNDQLKIVGNGVCPQQAAAALRYLLEVTL